MKNLQKSYIMLTYSLGIFKSGSISGTRSCKKLFHVPNSLRTICVHSLMTQSKLVSHATGVINPKTSNGNTELFRLFNRPFKSLSLVRFSNSNNISNTAYDTAEVGNPSSAEELRFLMNKSDSIKNSLSFDAETKDDNTNVSNDNLNDLESVKHLQELQKQAIWDIGPALSPTFTFAAYANESDVVKRMLDFGVDLSKFEKREDILPIILKLDVEQISSSVKFLVENGINPEQIGWYITKNPFILQEDLINLEKRLDYLRSKKFTSDQILRVISTNPFWLSFSIPRIDRRLGFFQSYFGLSANLVRKLATSGPKLITSNLGRVKDMTFKVKEEMGFTSEEIISMIVERPRIWREDPKTLWRRFDYLHNEVKFSHADIVRCPDLLLVRESRLKSRIGFLMNTGKAQFDPEKPNYIAFKMIYENDDSHFATNVAKSSVIQFNEYLKTL